MIDLNAIDKEESLKIIKELFSEMCSSRRQLKPILSEILRAIDSNIFIDADSEEVKELLEEILRMQDRLSQVNDLKSATKTQKIAVIDDAIREIDQKYIVNELKTVLAKFKNLICDSNDDNEIDAAKKLKRQAQKLSMKAEKMDAELFSQEGSKFINIAEIISDPSTISSMSFLDIQNNFPENKFLAYTIMKRSLRFDVDEKAEATKLKEQQKNPEMPKVEVKVEEPKSKNISNEIETTKTDPKDAEQERLKSLKLLVEEYKLSVDELLIDEKSIEVETKNIRKRLSVKSLNNKLHEFIDGSESISFPILRTFCKCRVFSTDPIFGESQEDKSRILLPVIVEKLYNWGIADKIYWQGFKFYYLNDGGHELLVRILSVKDVKSTKIIGESNKEKIAGYIRRFILFATVWALKIKKSSNKIDVDSGRFWIRSSTRIPTNPQQSFFSFSLMLFDENWLKNIDNFLQAYKKEEANGKNIKGVFLVSNLERKNLNLWTDFFESLGVHDIFIFMIAKDAYKLTNSNEDEIVPSEWSKSVSFGLSSETDEKFLSAAEDDAFDNDEEKLEEEKSEEIEETTEDIKKTSEEIDSKIIDDESEKKIIDDESESGTEIIEDVPQDEKNNSKLTVESDFQIPNFELNIPSDEISFNDKFNEGILLYATKFFIEGNTSRGMLFLHLLINNSADYDDWAINLVQETGYILDDPVLNQQLKTFDPFDFWDSYYSIPNIKIDDLYDYLNLAAITKSFFAPSEPMSFQLKSRWNQLNDDRSNVALKNCPSVKKLINLFKNFAEQTHSSFASCLNIDNSAVENELMTALESIKTVRERTEAVSHTQIRHPRSKGMVKILYDPEGQINKLLNVENESFSNVDSIVKFCSQFTEEDINRLDSQNIVVTEEIFSEAKVGDFLDEIWSSIKVESRKNEKFTSVERPRQVNLLKQVLVALVSYAIAKKHFDSIKISGKHHAPKIKALELLRDIVDEFTKIKPVITANFIGSAVFITFIKNLANQIGGESAPPFYRDCLLGSKYLELSKEGLPITKSYGVNSFSFTKRVFNFVDAVENLSMKEAVKSAYEMAVRSCDLGILKLLEANFKNLLERSDEELRRRQDNVAKQVDRQIDRIYHEFLDNIELDRNYDRITNQEEIDRYINIATEAKKHFEETKNAGIYQRFIDACSADISEAALPHKNALMQRLKNLTEKLYSELDADENLEEKYPILSEINHQLEIGNLTVAEDYLNRRIDNNGQFNNPDVIESQNDSFESFLKDYEYIFSICLKNKSDSLEKIHSRMRGGGIAKNRSERDAVDFVSAWQGLNTDVKAKARAEISLVELLKHLSFNDAVIEKAEKIPPNQWNFHVEFPSYRRAKAAYPHPFAVYGTEIADKGLDVVYLASNRTTDNIIETLANYSVSSDCGKICLVDFALSLAERRRLAQAFKLRPDLKNIIVIDRVLAIFLTRFEDNVRGVKMLKAALPFACVQPYTTGSVVAPEMFIGRSKELAKIRDMSGPVFVYGGRQLGKSALLRQVRNIENDPENSNFAFFIELKGLDSEKSLEKIVRELKDVELIAKNKSVNNWDDFSLEINDLLSGRTEQKKPKKLILLLDESDEFLASVENSDSRAIDILRELRETFSGSFKFVLAGLHKVIRFEKNSSFGNLDHISILPFSPTDALELLLKPMNYLGFVIDDQSLMSAIFSRANYYPGLIQYYCKMIVDAAGDNYTQRNFDVTKNPPYQLDDEYLKNMLGKRDFQDEINKKFQITLKLDDDNFYEIIALVIALAYYENNRPVHVSLEKIRENCFIYDIDKIADMSDSSLESLLGEMVELNLLRKVDGDYEFNRYAFWHMMGTESEVNARLEKYGMN